MANCAYSTIDEGDASAMGLYRRSLSYSVNFNSLEIKSIFKENLGHSILQLDSCQCHLSKSACPVSREMHKMLGQICNIQQIINKQGPNPMTRQHSFDFGVPPRSSTQTSLEDYHPCTSTDSGYSSLESFSSSMSSFDEDSSYVIKRGYLLIINNVHFKLRAGPRNGTIAEGEAVQAMFKSFGFDVRTEYNLTARDIKEILRQTASNPDMGKFDCFALLVLTHGKKAAILGTDNQSVDYRVIEQMLKGDSFPYMAGKPKLLFFQACRGNIFDDGLLIPRGGGNFARDSRKNQPVVRIPTDSDFLLIYATTFGRMAYKDVDYFRGKEPVAHSWFLEALQQVLQQFWGKEDLLTMLTRVNSHVAIVSSNNFQEVNKGMQIPCQFSTLRYRIFFAKS